MAPGFLSKLVKPSGSHSRNSSAQSSPQSPSSSSRNPSISISSTASSKSASGEGRQRQGNGNGSAAASHGAGGYESSDSGPNVTVVPPSPSVSGSSIPLPDPQSSPARASRELAPADNAESARRRIQSLPASALTAPTPSALPRIKRNGRETWMDAPAYPRSTPGLAARSLGGCSAMEPSA